MTTTANLNTQLNDQFQQMAPHVPSILGEDLTPSFYAQFTNAAPSNTLKVGDAAPDFTLTDQTGAHVSLKELLGANKFVILVWYRGEWCPFCNLTLRAHNTYLNEYKALGAQFVAITPQLPDQTPNITNKLSLNFTVLSDINNVTARKYGILNELSKNDQEIFQKFGNNYNEIYGNNSYIIPHPSTFIINSQTQKIIFQQTNVDWRTRTEPKVIIDLLKANQ